MRCLAAVTDIACALGDIKRADEAAQRAESMAQGQRGLGLQVLALQSRGTVEAAKGNPEAHAILRRALRMWQEIDAPYEAAMVRLVLARALRLTGDEAGARRECEAALAAFERLGAQPDAERARELASAPTTPTQTLATRTLFFSDIVGSTQLVEAIGDEAWTDVVAWLDGAMRECFAHHGGEEVDHAGDGFFVAFGNSASAIECAITISGAWRITAGSMVSRLGFGWESTQRALTRRADNTEDVASTRRHESRRSRCRTRSWRAGPRCRLGFRCRSLGR